MEGSIGSTAELSKKMALEECEHLIRCYECRLQDYKEKIQGVYIDEAYADVSHCCYSRYLKDEYNKDLEASIRRIVQLKELHLRIMNVNNGTNAHVSNNYLVINKVDYSQFKQN